MNTKVTIDRLTTGVPGLENLNALSASSDTTFLK